jgi:hypothetical protein
MWKITPEQMGGKARPVTLVGFLCKIYSAAVTQVGALGPTALERALVANIAPDQLGMLGYDSLRLPRLVGWEVAAHLDSQIGPSEKPFSHLDIQALPSKLKSALGG